MNTVLPDLLQTLEHVVESHERTSAVALDVFQEMTEGRSLPPATLADYIEQLKRSAVNREQMGEMIAQWWQMLGADASQ